MIECMMDTKALYNYYPIIFLMSKKNKIIFEVLLFPYQMLSCHLFYLLGT